MPFNIRIVSTYPPRKCGIATFSKNLADALVQFTGEVGHIRVAAIDNDNGTYAIPVDVIIDQYDPASWHYATKDIIARASEAANPTVVVLQHEYGLDPDPQTREARGDNFLKMAKAFSENGLLTVTYLHTVLDQPNDYQKTTLQDLAHLSNTLIVTTESAIDILESPPYDIDPLKLKHIDHGIRMHHPSQFDRLAIKKKYNLEDQFLIITLGLLSPDKGIQYGIRAYGNFLQNSCTPDQRRNLLYLIAGQCHPEFVKADSGTPYRQFQEAITQALEASGLRQTTVSRLGQTGFADYDVVFFDSFLEENILLDLYRMANVVLLPYLNMNQISSGILADTVGSGRIPISTKFRYALELIHSNNACPPGVVVGRHERGILVDAGPPCVQQIAQALDLLVFDTNRRLIMERQAHQRGYQMRWNNHAWALLQHIEFLKELKDIVTGRGIKLTRQKTPVNYASTPQKAE